MRYSFLNLGKFEEELRLDVGRVVKFMPGADAGAADGGGADVCGVELAGVEVDHVEPPRRPQLGHVEEENLEDS